MPTLPCALRSWENLDAEDWKWRVLHLNSLNLFKVAWSDQKDRNSSKGQEVKDWLDKGRFIFSTSTRSDTKYPKGRRQLLQLLRTEEGFPDDFYNWLINSKIIPEDFLPERHPTRPTA